MKKALLFLLVLTFLMPLIWVLIFKFEGQEPVIEVTLPSQYLKESYEMSVNVSDFRNGLRNIKISIVQQGKEVVLLDKPYLSSGISGVYSCSETASDSLVIPVQAWKYGMSDGDAQIRIKSADYAWRGWNKGNIAYVEKNVIIDTKPPKIVVLTDRHNVERGGAGLVIYKLFEENIKSGIQVGDNFFPGHSGLFGNKEIYAAFFALDHMQGPGTQLFVLAEDMAGNVTKRGFHHYIRDENFKTDILDISDSFLELKMPDFNFGPKEVEFKEDKNPLLKKFIYINREIRKENVEKILAVPEVTDNIKYWTGSFLRLNGSARKAGFADRRIYKYQGNEIDRAVHLGIDLAATANAPVTAANSGRVILAEFVGIFGNTVIIDHGFGLCSLYAHLNQISVQQGDTLEKGAPVGATGFTGLAGGDHLHFSMIVHNVFVNPVEWWDDAWIKNNITSKIEQVEKMPDL